MAPSFYVLIKLLIMQLWKLHHGRREDVRYDYFHATLFAEGEIKLLPGHGSSVVRRKDIGWLQRGSKNTITILWRSDKLF